MRHPNAKPRTRNPKLNTHNPPSSGGRFRKPRFTNHRNLDRARILQLGFDSLSELLRDFPRPIIRHAPGHATHIHIRFYNPIAQETARRCHSLLLAAKLTSAPQSYISHKVKKNETLGMMEECENHAQALITRLSAVYLKIDEVKG